GPTEGDAISITATNLLKGKVGGGHSSCSLIEGEGEGITATNIGAGNRRDGNDGGTSVVDGVGDGGLNSRITNKISPGVFNGEGNVKRTRGEAIDLEVVNNAGLGDVLEPAEEFTGRNGNT